MTTFRWMTVLVLSLLISYCVKGGTYSLSLRYQTPKEFPSLQKRIGTTLGMVPVKDERPATLFIGIHNPLQGLPQRFKSEPIPLERAVAQSLSEVFARHGVKTVPVPEWDERPESLAHKETDSVLLIRIKRFWAEGEAGPFMSKLKISVHFVFHLGLKREGRVFTSNVEAEREMTLFNLTPRKIEILMSQILTEVIDNFLSNPNY